MFQPHYGQKGTLEELQAQIANIHRTLVEFGAMPQNAAQQAIGAGSAGTANSVAGVAGSGSGAPDRLKESAIIFDPSTGHNHAAGVATAVPMSGDVSGTNQSAVVSQSNADFTVGQYLNVNAVVPVSTQRGLVSLGAGGFAGGAGHFAGGAAGTALAINLPTGATSRLLDLQIGGVSKMIVGAGGVVTVPTAIAAGGIELAIATKTGAYTALGTDFLLLGDATGGAFNFNLPAVAGTLRWILVFKKIDASVNAITVQANGAELIDGANTFVLAARYDTVRIESDGTQWWKW